MDELFCWAFKGVHAILKSHAEGMNVRTILRRAQSPSIPVRKRSRNQKRSGDLIFKVGEKGGVSVYGLGRFPVTLYYEQWNRLLGAAADIKTFLEENKSRLKLKE